MQFPPPPPPPLFNVQGLKERRGFFKKKLGDSKASIECNFELEKCKATSSVIALPVRNILSACDDAFKRRPYKTSILLLVFTLTVCSLLLQFQDNKGRKKNVFRRVWKNVMSCDTFVFLAKERNRILLFFLSSVNMTILQYHY